MGCVDGAPLPHKFVDLAKGNAELISVIEGLRVSAISRMRKIGARFHLDPNEAVNRWNEAIEKLKTFADCSSVLKEN